MASIEDPIAPTGGYPVQSSAEDAHDTDSTLRAHLRPNIVRRETDLIPSYYQSEYAGRPYARYEQESRPQLKRQESQGSQASRSGSEYSAESLRDTICEAYTRPQEPTALLHVSGHSRTHQRRPSVPSPESADRRRLAIVELDSIPPSVSRKGGGRAQTSGVSSSSILSRRGLHVKGLALVAPPDASPATYTNLTPPPTAPIFPQGIAQLAAYTHARSASDTVGSKARLRHQSSRDIGIVGTGAIHPVAEMSIPPTPSNEGYRSYMDAPIFQTPSKSRSSSPAVFTPDLSHSVTTAYADSFVATSSSDTAAANMTPAIGEGKDVRQPVVGPVVVNLDSDRVMRHPVHAASGSTASFQPQSAQHSTSSSSYLYYEPGVHSTAGPLPPPPMSVLDPEKPPTPAPPRPPRLRTPLPVPVAPLPSSAKPNLDALKESLQLPLSVSAKLGPRPRPETSRRNTDTSVYSLHSNESGGSGASKLSEPVVEVKRTHSIHRREGAFAPSTPSAGSTPNQSPEVDKLEPQSTLSLHTYSSPLASSLPVVEPESDVDHEPTRRPVVELRRESSWVSLHETDGASSPNGKAQALPEKDRSPSRSPDLRSLSLPPLPPPKTGKGVDTDDVRTPLSGSGSSNPFKVTLSNLKRFSALPRTPSSISIRSLSKTRSSTPRTSREPSPAPALTPKISPRPRIVDPNPPALNFRDITNMKFAHERAQAYAERIKELSMCDPGLQDWIVAMQARGDIRDRVSRRQTEPDIPSEFGARTQPWHVASGSVDSEVTFPRRADAYHATDLTMRPDEEILPLSLPSSLPYPSLVTLGLPSRSPPSLPSIPPSTGARTYQVPLSGGLGAATRPGFFASIGRRASLKKSTIGPPSPPRVLKKLAHTSPSPPPARPIQVNSAPTVRGGPRAPPHRLARSKTVSASPPDLRLQNQPVQSSPQVALTRSETRSTYRQSASAARRPSLLHRSAAPPPPLPGGPEFEKQLEDLAALLPHAERDVLAGYLRRAGENILAIGLYLEDEKNGTLRHD